MKKSINKKRYSKKRNSRKRYPRKRNSKRKSIKRKTIKRNSRRKKYSRKTLLRKKYIYSKKNLKGGSIFDDDDQYFRIYMVKEDDSGSTIIIPGLIFKGTSDLKSLKSIRGKLDKVLRIQDRPGSLKTKMIYNSDNHAMHDVVDIPDGGFASFKFFNNDEGHTLINNEGKTNLENILQVDETDVGYITGNDLLEIFNIQEENLRQNEVRKVAAAAEAKRVEEEERVAEEERVEAEAAAAAAAEAAAEAGEIEYDAAKLKEEAAAAKAVTAAEEEKAKAATAAEEKAKAATAEAAAAAEEEAAAVEAAAEKGATTEDLLKKLEKMRSELKTRIEENQYGQNQVIALNKQVHKLGKNRVLLQKAEAEAETAAAVTVAETAEKAKVEAEAEAVKAREAASAASTEKELCLLKIQTLESKVDTMGVNTQGQETLSCVVEVEEAKSVAAVAKKQYLNKIKQLETKVKTLQSQMTTGDKMQYTEANEFITEVINALKIS